MVEPSMTQLLVVVGFLAVLVAVQVLVRRHAKGIGGKLGRGREIRLIEVTTLGSNERLSLVETGGQRVLVLTGRHGAGAFLTLGPVAPDRAADAP